MKTYLVNTKSKKYPIFIGKNILIKFCKLKEKYLNNTKKILIITSKNIPKKYFLKIKKNLKNTECYTIILPNGERIKQFDQIIKITDLLSKYNFNRKDCVVALGGGVIGDLSGFAASIFKRGINFVQIPTTLLSQVDSSVGGKTGINNSHGKNLIGTFYQPNFVLIDTDTLHSLPKREMVAGFAEILKYSLILDKTFFNWLYKNGKKILSKNYNLISHAIYKSCKFKAYVVKKDEKEKNLRAILNYGHTFAHAIETINNYSKKIIHGEAVLIGMMLAARLSNHMKYLSSKDLSDIKEIYKQLKLNYNYKNFVNKKNIKKIFKIMSNDKKSNGKTINIILLKKIGSAIIKKTSLEKTFFPLINQDLKNGKY
jgi:3-dehydroquinate synthase